uniref:DENN/MADD domain containing 6Aa isoform X1 n=1 Tax=Doryrhamphus excisus TaxID=161450 RepID=UPI0025AEAFC9|nr:DENN/MADD domain containing 6Aa isoform X1 [Doryrhamphus excisus]
MALQGPEELGEPVEEPEDLDDHDASSISPAEEITLPAGPGGDDDPAGTLLLPWDRFSAWLHCICVVGFDLELGQAVEVIYPHHSKLSEKEKTSICYLSFPDSNSVLPKPGRPRRDDMFAVRRLVRVALEAVEDLPRKKHEGALEGRNNTGCLGDTQFCFRFRQGSNRKSSLGCFLESSDRDAPPCLKREQGHYYGYVYFRQVRDKSLKRGYFQKSLVLISKLPYVTFFHSVLKIMAPEYFEKQEPCLEAACNDIDRWPTPHPGRILTLPIMGVVIKVRIPTCYDKPGTTQLVQSAQSDSLVSIVLPTIHEVDLFRCFFPVFFHIQMLWELVLLGEALVVMAPSPAESSDTVLALVSCISPLRYSSDFRPYFTIHDSEFKEYTTRTQAPPSSILGVTNPFFAKTLQHWPHIIRIGDMKQAGEMAKQMKVKKLKNLKTLDSKPGVYTAYKPYLNKDEEIIKQLQKGVHQKRPSAAQNAILRRYFLELTQSFIIPLERYVASLMPLQKSISPWKSPPQLRPFVQQDFMKTLEKAGPQLTSRLKGDWIGLYRHFLKSPNFDGWFRNRRKEMTQKLEALHLEVLCEEDLQQRVQKHSEVETVDLVLKLKDKLSQAEREHLPVQPGTVAKLRAHMEGIILSLPEDLQGILHKPSTP